MSRLFLFSKPRPTLRHYESGKLSCRFIVANLKRKQIVKNKKIKNKKPKQ